MPRSFSISFSLLGTAISAAILAILVVAAVYYTNAKEIVAVIIYGSLITLFHMAHLGISMWRAEYEKAAYFFNKNFIFLLVAGSYTPIFLGVLPPARGWSLFGVSFGL